jgi:hypothetical protein
MQRSEGKAWSLMLAAKREVARQHTGSVLAKEKDGASRSWTEECEGKVGSGPACERSSQWRKRSVDELKSGGVTCPESVGAASWMRENSFKLTR